MQWRLGLVIIAYAASAYSSGLRACHRLDAGSEKALATAKERGWTVVSMQNDFKVVFGL